MTSTFERYMKDPSFREKFDKEYKELVTSDDIPDNPLSVPISNKDKKKIKIDPLYQQRLKQNPNLRKNIKKLGEQTMITVTFTSNDSEAISKQWHTIFHIDDKSWNSWEISNPEVSGNTYRFTLVSHQEDQRLENEDYLKNHLVAGVTMNMSKSAARVSESDIVGSLIESGMDTDKLLDVLLADDLDIQEAEVPDDKDGESDTVDAAQKMLTQMLPLTKNLKMGKEEEAELKKHLSAAMSLMKGKKS